MRYFLIAFLFMISAAGTTASQSGGVVYLHDPDDTLAWGPILCSSDICQQVQRLVLPTLFAYDPTSLSGIGGVDVSTGQDTALVTEVVWDADGTAITLTLRSDLLWEDGQPVTAYDVFYSYLVQGVKTQFVLIPLDDHTLRMSISPATCTLMWTQTFVMPAHAFQADFTTLVSQFGFNTEDSIWTQIGSWRTMYPTFNAFTQQQNPYNITMPITLMGRDMAMVSPGDFLRVQFGQGDDSVGLHIYNNLPSEGAVDYFLAGQLDILRDAPFLRWPDLAAAENVKLYRRPTGEKGVLVFNLNNANEAQPYADQFGNLLKQVPHPILSDLKVRQAIAAAIDVNELITVGLNGFGTPSNETFEALSDLTTPDTPRFDPEHADRLLTEAGWVRAASGSDQTRRCQDCATAEDNTILRLSLLYTPTTDGAPMAAAMKRQLERVGISIELNASEGAINALPSQFYDMAFVTRNTPDADLARWFLTVNDGDINGSSYTNATVDSLLPDIDEPSADHACNTSQLHDLYAQADQEIMVDLPEITLFAFENVMAVRDWVLNTDYIPMLDPVFGAAQWQVFYGPQEQ